MLSRDARLGRFRPSPPAVVPGLTRFERAQTLHRVAAMEGLRLGATERGSFETAWIHDLFGEVAVQEPGSRAWYARCTSLGGRKKELAMRYRGFPTWILSVMGAAALLIGGCGADDASSGKGSLQSSCVSDQLNLERMFPDGSECDNWGYSDCYGFASECINYCANGFCQPQSCDTAADCVEFFREIPLGVGWECNEYVVSSTS